LPDELDADEEELEALPELDALLTSPLELEDDGPTEDVVVVVWPIPPLPGAPPAPPAPSRVEPCAQPTADTTPKANVTARKSPER
jgi:hypothetical protein